MRRALKIAAALVISLGINLAVLLGVVRLRTHQNPPASPPRFREAPPIARQAPKAKPKPRPKRHRPRVRAWAPAPIPALALPAMVSAPEWAPPEVEEGGVLHTDSAEGLGGQPTGLIMSEASVDVPPTPMETRAPSYPAQARRDGLEGTVKARLLVGVDGAVRQVTVLSCDPPGVFDAAASEALYSWRFRPGRFQGQPVPVWVRKTIRFELE